MKSSTSKILAVLINVILILFLFFNIVVNADEGSKSIILNKAKDEYIIYYKEICEKEFQFAISTNKDEKEENLVFINSVKDKETEKSSNVIYINEDLHTQIFVDGENTLTKAYIWIKDTEGNVVLKADEIDLTTAINDDIINFVDTTTKRINVDTTKTYETKQDINGVATSVTVGKVDIIPNSGSTYSYKLIKADDTNKKEKEFFELAEKIQAGTDSTYESLTLSKSFYEYYNELIPTEKEWKEVENNEILQPETTRQGDKYIVWLKEISKDGNETVDAKFLVSIYEYVPEYVNEDKVITELVKSPVTYDNPALIIIFVLVIVAIIVLILLRAKTTKKSKH